MRYETMIIRLYQLSLRYEARDQPVEEKVNERLDQR